MICVPLDGFLRVQDGSLNEEALVLAKAIGERHRLAILLDDEETSLAEHWLKAHGMIEYTHLVVGDKKKSASDMRIQQVRQLRAQRYSISYVLDHRPDVVIALYKENIPSLLCLHPEFALPEARPDYRITVRPWDDLVQEIEGQQVMRAEREREEVAQ